MSIGVPLPAAAWDIYSTVKRGERGGPCTMCIVYRIATYYYVREREKTRRRVGQRDTYTAALRAPARPMRCPQRADARTL